MTARVPRDADVVQAVGSASRLLGRHCPYSRVEVLAYAALIAAYPEAPAPVISEMIGLDADWDAGPALAAAERAKWWHEDLLNEIVGELVAPLYGEVGT